MRKTSWRLVLVLAAGCTLNAAPASVALARTAVYESAVPVAAETQVDKLVFGKLAQLGLEPANPCSDSVFVRRVYLDLIGTLPTAAEAREFLVDRSTDKRHQLIERLLKRGEFADCASMKWSDLLRVKAEFPINLWPNAAQSYYRWIHTSLRDNKPYDQFVREMLTGNGSNFREGQVNFYRAMQNHEPQGIAQVVALTLMGSRIEKWPKERAAGMANFFSQLGYKATSEWKEEIVYYDSSASNAQWSATFPDGKTVRLMADRDPREVFADWLIDPKNPWFTRNIANRVWSWLLGRGIIQEPDDIRPENPPSNPELLAYLEQELISSKYDLKQLYRVILNSRTYQLSSLPKSNDPRADANFARYVPRRLDAEVLIDALNQITGSSEKYSSPIPEPFTFIPEGARSIALQDGSITSPFLELFGRPPRDTGTEDERNNRMTAAQRLHLLNSSHIQRKLDESPLVRNLTAKSDPRQTTTGIYLSILSRYPTESELQAVGAYSRALGKGRESVVDTAWALINSAEFLYRH